MATAAECEQALQQLAARLAEKDASSRARGFDRTLSCTVTDLGVAYAGTLRDGLLENIATTAKPGSAQVRLELTGDDLVAMVDGRLNLASAWAAGRIKVHAGVLDMIKLRSVF
ncbi:alkyl sulfatase C-terminal domain-containing protein [Jatrophihabitans endophyticus]|uniref:alkyl sulfatase C-terminal domain-containing protein n=1 Tax=Jatrophihabitans endophyticus TaxID=1206085 RepID=UPI0019FE7F30|nr:alkyl sulfatase C-terminal domain-containing protein [Jatrophihabitans endophyticus]MBE7186776.1 SCP2 sterol-binding domain-containing protein [Jatrophihabitans endophyticus]